MKKETASRRMLTEKTIRGLWLENLGATCALSSPEKLRAALDFAAQQGYTDVYLQIYREGRAWFRSRVAGQEFYDSASKVGFRPVREAVSLAHDRNLRVHGWFNVFNLGLNFKARLLHDSGQELLLSDNREVSIARYAEDGSPPDSRSEYFVLDAPKLWLDPSSPEVLRYFKTIVQESLEEAPELHGVHLDFFRFPYCLPIQPSSRITCGFEFGYGAETRQRFEEHCAVSGAFLRDKRGDLRPKDDVVSLRFDQWRRQQLSNYLVALRDLIADRVLSVACLAWPERAYFSAYQNWREWLESELLNQACLMAYTADDEHFRYLVKQASAFQSSAASLLAGVGCYLHRERAQTERQCERALECGARGFVTFSYENLRKQLATV